MELRGKKPDFWFFCRNFPRLFHEDLLQVNLRVSWQSNNIPEQLLEHRIVRVTAVWPRITHSEGEAHEVFFFFFFCMGRRMEENPKNQGGNERPFKLCCPWTGVDGSMAVVLNAGLARCTGRQNDPAGSPAHPWRRCVSVTQSCPGHFIPILPGETRHLWVLVMEKRSFSLPFSVLLPSWRKPSFYFGLMLSCLEGVRVC